MDKVFVRRVLMAMVIIIFIFQFSTFNSTLAQGLSHRLDSVVQAAKMLETSQMGLMVYDLDGDSVVYARDERQTLRPASTMKIITAITALDRLGADYRYRTRLAYTGGIAESIARNELGEPTDTTATLTGDLYLVGGMDPMIGKAELIALADSIKALGIDTIRGRIYADRSMKDADLYGEGWCWDDDNPMLSPLVYGRKDNMTDNFRSLLMSRGVCVSGKTGVRTCPKDTVTIAEVTHSLGEILVPMMKQSNNLYAESVYYQIGLTQGKPSTAKKARRVEEELLKRVWGSLKDMYSSPIYRFADGSGLSLYNYVSAEIEVALLRYAYADDTLYCCLTETLPIAGIDGTLKDRMKGTAAEGNVKAKTGTLSGVSSLAGYCTAANGNRIAFAIINQGVMQGKYAKALQDRLCEELCK